MRWDPGQYSRYADERGRPFYELTSRVAAESPHRVADLGCGTGELTLTLAERWPGAEIHGVDSSAEMIERARSARNVRFERADAGRWNATGFDVLVSNAMLQWVDDHEALLARWAAELNLGGWLAFQVPANFDAPSHRLMRELAESPAWSERLGGLLRRPDAVAEPARYVELLAGEGLTVDAWQTEYLHILNGPDPVLEWVRGTGLRPVLDVLDGAEADAFTAEYAARLRDAYPARPYGTAFGFRRTFVVAHKPE